MYDEIDNNRTIRKQRRHSFWGWIVKAWSTIQIRGFKKKVLDTSTESPRPDGDQPNSSIKKENEKEWFLKIRKKAEAKYEEEFKLYKGRDILKERDRVCRSQTALRRLMWAVDVAKENKWLTKAQHQSIRRTAAAMLEDLSSVSQEYDGAYSVVGIPSLQRADLQIYNDLAAIATDLTIIWGRKADKINDFSTEENHLVTFLTVLAAVFLPLNFFSVCPFKCSIKTKSVFGMNIQELQGELITLPHWWVVLVSSVVGTLVFIIISWQAVGWWQERWKRNWSQMDDDDRDDNSALPATHKSNEVLKGTVIAKKPIRVRIPINLLSPPEDLEKGMENNSENDNDGRNSHGVGGMKTAPNTTTMHLIPRRTSRR